LEENHCLESKSLQRGCCCKKNSLASLLVSNREEIKSGRVRVFLIDECHLLWGDLTGYVWGKTDLEIAVRVINERDKQTYYGAVDYSFWQVTFESLQCW
jgi:hypothetical protein